MPHKINQGGVKPRNTLAGGSTLSTIGRSLPKAVTDKQRKGLDLRASRGSNVNTGAANESSGTPPSKRRKISNSPGSDVTATSLSGMSAGDVLIDGQPANQPRKASIDLLGPKRLAKSPDEGSGLHEYWNVEKLMNSEIKSNNKMKRQRSNGSQEQVHSQSKPVLPQVNASSTHLNPIDMTLEEDDVSEEAPQPKPPYAGTMRPTNKERSAQDVNNARKAPAVSEKSPYFEEPSLPSRTSHQSARLSSKFVAENGERRGAPAVPSSPDELTAGTTVGNHTEPHTVVKSKRRRTGSTSQASTLKLSSTLQSAHGTGLDRSNIPAAQFSNSRIKKTDTVAREAPPPWSVGVAAINVSGQPRIIQGENYGLVHNEKENYYSVLWNGKPFKTGDVLLELHPKRIWKILHENDGAKMRFELHRDGTSDSVIDLELLTEKDSFELLRRLQIDRAIQVKRESSERMERLFENRRNQILHPRATQSSVSADPNQVTSQRIPSKKQTLANRSDTQPKTELVRDVIGKTKEPALPKTKIPVILDKLNIQPEDIKNLRRSTRTSGASFNLQEKLQDYVEEPDIPKWSKTHPLRKWRRPVTYPSTGKKKATVEFSDIERLDEGEFLNDSLVTFHMRYLQHKMEVERPELAKQIYFFSTFFYQRLTDFQKGTREVNFQAVQSWTRNVDIFTYDYIVVPINESAHWYLAIICNLPALDRKVVTSDGDNDEDDGNTATGEPIRNSILSPSEPQDPEYDTAQATVVPVDDTESSTEKGTRDSFSNLSLETSKDQQNDKGDGRPSSQGVGNHKYEDHDMLDAPVPKESTTEVLESVKVPISREHNATDTTKDDTNKVQIPRTLKKQKRKSNPPVTFTDPRRPLVLTFDSLGAPHGNTIKFLKEYLFKEMQDKRGAMDLDVGSIKGINARSIPQQSNFSDCGLYVLGYLNKFMEDGPSDFVAKIIRREYKDEDWSKLNGSTMRNQMRELLLNLNEQQNREYCANKKARRKSGDTEASSPIPPTSSAPSAIENEPTDASSRPAEPASSRTSQDPSPVTRGEALQNALPVEESYSLGANDQLLREEAIANHYDQQVAAQDSSGNNQQAQAELAVHRATPIRIESQSQEIDASDLPSSQTPKPLPERVSLSPGLPSVVEDSQDYVSPQPALPAPKPKPKSSPLPFGDQVHSEKSWPIGNSGKGSPLPVSATYSKKDRKRRAEAMEEDRKKVPKSKQQVIELDD